MTKPKFASDPLYRIRTRWIVGYVLRVQALILALLGVVTLLDSPTLTVGFFVTALVVWIVGEMIRGAAETAELGRHQQPTQTG